MRIAMLAPISWRVPPRHYGPWERVVSLLTEGLVKSGIDVTLFATLDSQTQASLKGICPHPYSEDPNIDAKVWECLHISEVFEHASEFDLIHNQFDFLPLSYSKLIPTPLLTTIHGFSSERILPVFQKYNGHAHYVSISNADRHSSLDYIATVYHGIDLDEFTPQENPDDYLLFFGRIHHEKGVAEAIETAKQTNHRLVIAGIIQDQSYFNEHVKPHLDDDQVTYIGSVGPKDRDRVLGNAKALLHLINFNEPFGLSMIEAMACGTPVIATPRGSVKEIVVNGKTGFHARNVEDAVRAVNSLGNIHRASLREYVGNYFSVEQMVQGYLKVYEKILNSR